MQVTQVFWRFCYHLWMYSIPAWKLSYCSLVKERIHQQICVNDIFIYLLINIPPVRQTSQTLLKTLELYILLNRWAVWEHQSLLSVPGFWLWGELLVSHILMGLFKITGIRCMSSDWHWLSLHFQSKCITAEDFNIM